ncbi:MAG: glycoside hydrolase family 88 protein [Saprospirales bacterium]|nr:glycoside hydrolase family 88 protein [Saprospirales bacterium]
MKENPQSYMVDFQKKPKWNYTGGLVMLAMQETWRRTGKEEYYAYAKSYADS